MKKQLLIGLVACGSIVSLAHDASADRVVVPLAKPTKKDPPLYALPNGVRVQAVCIAAHPGLYKVYGTNKTGTDHYVSYAISLDANATADTRVKIPDTFASVVSVAPVQLPGECFKQGFLIVENLSTTP